MPAFEVTKTVPQFSYLTERKPDGGFVARPLDPSIETFEGATEEEVQQKVFAAIATALSQKVLAKDPLSGQPVTIKLDSAKPVTFKKLGTTFNLVLGDSFKNNSSNSDAPVPIQFERSRLRGPVILLIVALAVILYAIVR